MLHYLTRIPALTGENSDSLNILACRSEHEPRRGRNQQDLLGRNRVLILAETIMNAARNHDRLAVFDIRDMQALENPEASEWWRQTPTHSEDFGVGTPDGGWFASTALELGEVEQGSSGRGLCKMGCLDSVGEFGGARQVAVAPRVVFDSHQDMLLETNKEQQARETICMRFQKGKHTRSRGWRGEEHHVPLESGHGHGTVSVTQLHQI
jgi:hypothetical protein